MYVTSQIKEIWSATCLIRHTWQCYISVLTTAIGQLSATGWWPMRLGRWGLCGLMTNHPSRHPANHWIAFIDILKCFDDGQKKVTFLLSSWTYVDKSWKYHGNFLACATIKSNVGFKFNMPIHPKSSYTENYTAYYTWVTLLNKFLLVEAANIAHYHLGRSLWLCVCIALVAMLFSDLTDF